MALVFAVSACAVTQLLAMRSYPRVTLLMSQSPLSAADEQRLLMSQPALSAFIVAEMRSFCENSMAALPTGEGSMAAPPGDLADKITAKKIEIGTLEEVGGSEKALTQLREELEAVGLSRLSQTGPIKDDSR